MVGAVITHKGRIVGEGFTSPFGGPHAEVRAIEAVADPALLREATLYVTLEPCCHHGKTPPCTDLILKVGIPKVVIGVRDPHEKVKGQGIEKLLDGGCQVEIGVMEAACREHHRRFLTFHEKKRPYVILKWAQSADGLLAPEDALRNGPPHPFWISGPASRQLVHRWRSEEQAILVGTRTALKDNPRLNTRLWAGRSPVRILIDRKLQVPGHFHILDGEVPTLVYHQEGTPPQSPKQVQYKALGPGGNVLEQIMKDLWEEGIQSVLVEGGARTLNTFKEAGCWDEARIIEGPALLGEGLPAPRVKGRLVETRDLDKDRIRILRHD